MLSLYRIAWVEGKGEAIQVWRSDRSIKAKVRSTLALVYLSPLNPKVVSKAAAMRLVLRDR